MLLRRVNFSIAVYHGQQAALLAPLLAAPSLAAAMHDFTFIDRRLGTFDGGCYELTVSVVLASIGDGVHSIEVDQGIALFLALLSSHPLSSRCCGRERGAHRPGYP